MGQRTITSRRLMLFLGLALLVGWSLHGCASHPDPWAEAGKRVRVVVTFAPLDSFVRKVGGDHVAVACLTAEEGPHHYDPRAKESITLHGAQLFVANGLGLDESILAKFKKSGLPREKELEVVELGEVLEEADKDRKKDKLLIPVVKVAGEDKGKDHGHGHAHDHGEGEWDPHVWLGFASTVPDMIDAIRDKLIKIDGEHEEDYRRNAAEFRKELLNLGSEASKALADKKDKKLVTTHDSLRYLARDLGLTIVGTVELAPGESRGAQARKELLKICQDNKIKYIALEPNNPKAKDEAEQIKKDLAAKDLKVKLIEIDPLETTDRKDLSADWYLKQMKKNIGTLKDELE